ncbi:MAG: hypothetical protein QM619_01260 [Micropruina sp.]|uniref:hypothetical protein n=1 Tax=Micropruina sp. TaxID=2737536 RepID=UPI0039E63C9C
MTGNAATPDAGGKRRPDSGRAGTQGELNSTKAAVMARGGELAAVRASAAKWQAGLSALVGVITGTVGIGIRDVLRAIDPWWATALAVLLTAAFLAAFVATLLALWAGGGMPRLVRTVTAREDDDHVTAKSAARSLKTAIWVTSGAVLTLVGALWVCWFAPPSADPVAIVETQREKVCGTTETVDGRLLVTVGRASVHVIDVADITRWEKVSRCP